MRTLILVTCLAAALASCTTAPEPQGSPVSSFPGLRYLPARRMAGEVIIAPFRYEFEGCSIIFAPAAARRVDRFIPDRRKTYRLRVVIMGELIPHPPPGLRGYGDGGRYPCQVRATRLMSIESAAAPVGEGEPPD